MTADRTERVTVATAAEVLGISAEAVRQRVKRGTMPFEKEPDGSVYVLLDTDLMRTDGNRTNDRTADQSPIALLEAMQDQIQTLKEQLALEREANRENRRLLAAALERVPPQLQPPNGPSESRESPLSPSEEPGRGEDGAEDAVPQKPASWWRRLFG